MKTHVVERYSDGPLVFTGELLAQGIVAESDGDSFRAYLHTIYRTMASVYVITSRLERPTNNLPDEVPRLLVGVLSDVNEVFKYLGNGSAVLALYDAAGISDAFRNWEDQRRTLLERVRTAQQSSGWYRYRDDDATEEVICDSCGAATENNYCKGELGRDSQALLCEPCLLAIYDGNVTITHTFSHSPHGFGKLQ